MSQIHSIEAQLKAFSEKYEGFSTQEAFLFRLIRMVDRQMTDRANYQLKQVGLTLTEYNALTMLDTSGEGLSTSELAERTGEKPSNITRLTDQLISKGLLVREVSAADRRVWLVRLTDDGRKTIHHLVPLISGQLNRIFDEVSDQDRSCIESTLKTLLKNIAGEPC